MDIAAQRLHNQRLVGEPFDSPRAAVRHLGAVQAQDFHGAKWAVALRTRDATDASLEQLFNAGGLLRLHVMRPTWHLVAPEDLRWLVALTGPRVHAANAHMYRKLELDQPVLKRASKLIARALEGERHLTRLEIAAMLQRNRIAARGQRLAYIVMHAEASALICSGALQGKQHTYALVDERVPPAPSISRDAALAMLARRYFTSHGPATVHDFSWWSGLTVADARGGAELASPDLVRESVDEEEYWTPTSTPAGDASGMHLLPNYDEHVVAYRNHRHSLDPRASAALPTRADRPLDVHLLARNGLIIGGWGRTLSKTRSRIDVTPLVPLRPRDRAALRRAAEEYGAFLGRPVELAVE